MPLTDMQIRSLKPAEKPYKKADSGGLFLLVDKSGGKWWRFKYRFGGKEKQLSLGTYPDTSLSDARDKRDAARKQHANGIDPGAIRKAMKDAHTEQETTFEVVAREWFSNNEAAWNLGHAVTVKSRLERDVYPAIGSRPISEIKAPEILAMLRHIEARGVLETAYRIKIICGQVFRYAAATGRTEIDPTGVLKGALQKRKEKHHAAITEPKQVAELLRAIDGFQGTFVVKCALMLAPMLFVRPGELQKAEWSEFDLDSAEWNIPANRMKMKQPHLVPLSKQAVKILRELNNVTGDGKYVFTCIRSATRPMSNAAMLAALRRMGYDKDTMTPHGFRATARTILEEVLQERYELIEHQLAHTVRDPNGRAYNRTMHLEARRAMMQKWSDYLDDLKAVAKVIPISSRL